MFTLRGFPASGERQAAWCFQVPRSIRGRTHRMNTRAESLRAPKGATMAQSFTGKKRIRKSFGRIPEAVRLEEFLQGAALTGLNIDQEIIGYVGRQAAAPIRQPANHQSPSRRGISSESGCNSPIE